MELKLILMFLAGGLYIFGGLILMAQLDEITGRTTRFLQGKDARLVFMIMLWPLVVPILFLPRYKAPRHATMVRHTKPLAES